MIWLYITIAAYLLFAMANVGDKLMISKYKTEPVVYAFYVGILGIATLVLIPFGVVWPGYVQLFWSFLAGVSFVLALYCMYRAINSGETTKAITIMGGTGPIVTFLLAYLFLNERLGAGQIGAFIFLVIAIIIISWDFSKGKKKKFNKSLVFWGILAGITFAFSYVLAKYVYIYQPFISGFVWIRVGGFVTSLLLLVSVANRKLIKADWQKPKKQKGTLLFAIQVLGGSGVIGQNYAFAIASASLVSALQAIQYAFIFILTSVLGKKVPVLKEELNIRKIIQKIIAIVLIAIGLYLLAIK